MAFKHGDVVWKCGLGDMAALKGHQCHFGNSADDHGHEHGNRKGDIEFKHVTL